MIIIIRALYQVREGMLETMIPLQVGMRLRTKKEEERGPRKKKKRREVQRERKGEEKEREKDPDQVEHTTPAQEHLSRGRSSSCIVHHQPLRQSTTPHTGVGYYTTSVARTNINLKSLVCSSF